MYSQVHPCFLEGSFFIRGQGTFFSRAWEEGSGSLLVEKEPFWQWAGLDVFLPSTLWSVGQLEAEGLLEEILPWNTFRNHLCSLLASLELTTHLGKADPPRQCSL